MKTTIYLFLIFLPYLSFAQTPMKNVEQTYKNAVMLTPLGDLINDAKWSIYFKRLLQQDSVKSKYLRIGTEVFSFVNLETRPGINISSRALNFKVGLEIEKRIGKRFSIFYGPEVSLSQFKANNAALRPSGGAIFFNGTITADIGSGISESKMTLFSLISFVGFKYGLTRNILIGVESAAGIGFFSTDINLIGQSNETESGNVFDLAASRFIFLEYRF